MIGNTAALNASGHPAISVPCAMRDGLPIGLMLVGRHFQEADRVARRGRCWRRSATGGLSDGRHNRAVRRPHRSGAAFNIRSLSHGNG